MLYQRAQCAINIDSPGERLNANLSAVSRELAKVRDNGLPQEEFDALIAQKNLELQKLFATYARTDTDILISQRMRSLQKSGGGYRAGAVSETAPGVPELTDGRHVEPISAPAAVAGYGAGVAAAERRAGVQHERSESDMGKADGASTRCGGERYAGYG